MQKYVAKVTETCRAARRYSTEASGALKKTCIELDQIDLSLIRASAAGVEMLDN